jgi:hypothetical protein
MFMIFSQYRFSFIRDDHKNILKESYILFSFGWLIEILFVKNFGHVLKWIVVMRFESYGNGLQIIIVVIFIYFTRILSYSIYRKFRIIVNRIRINKQKWTKKFSSKVFDVNYVSYFFHTEFITENKLCIFIFPKTLSLAFQSRIHSAWEISKLASFANKKM